MEQQKVLLDVKNLRTSFFTDEGEVKSVNDVSFHVNEKEVVAVVGESGSGKSVTQLSVIQLIQSPPGKILGGEVWFDGKDLMKFTKNEIKEIRGNGISMIFQEPMTSLNPVYTVGNQLTEVLRSHSKMSKKEAWQRGVEALAAVGIPDPEARMKNYPFEMSGGMRQRVMIAIAVACNSKLIVADEPTTALDVTTQAQVMELLLSLVKEKGTSIIVVTHNLGLVTRYADRIYVMYAGRIVESGTTEQLLTDPRHPYTLGLLASVPRLDSNKDEDLVPIEGTPPNLARIPEYCAFYPRCRYACEECKKKAHPELRPVGGDGHFIACHRNVKEG
ncbi:ABC transporter ATP-binding protein [uncultured Ruthenibacterium sp.]|uniref:ABC transporter ATP-binding protein n=1 Tax=uncultured Ruthenibacterium sp. TaxID=1905347 RepID=UPI00349E55A9